MHIDDDMCELRFQDKAFNTVDLFDLFHTWDIGGGISLGSTCRRIYCEMHH